MAASTNATYYNVTMTYGIGKHDISIEEFLFKTYAEAKDFVNRNLKGDESGSGELIPVLNWDIEPEERSLSDFIW